MATFKTLPAGTIRGVHSNLYPLLDADSLPIGFSSSKGDVLINAPAYLVSADFTARAEDDGKIFTCTTVLTIFMPELLSPRPTFIVNPPPTGNVSLDPTGAAQLNGAGTTLTRSRTNNPAGFVVTAYAESDGYGVSGS